MSKAASNIRIEFTSPMLPKMADHDDDSDFGCDENACATPLQIKRGSNGLMKLVATPKPVKDIDVITSVGLGVETRAQTEVKQHIAKGQEDEEEEQPMTMMQARQFRGVRMAMHAAKMQVMRAEAKIAALTSAKKASEAKYAELKQSLEVRLARMTKCAKQSKDTIRMLEKENERLERLADLSKFNKSTAWIIPTSVIVATFCLITAFALSN